MICRYVVIGCKFDDHCDGLHLLWTTTRMLYNFNSTVKKPNETTMSFLSVHSFGLNECKTSWRESFTLRMPSDLLISFASHSWSYGSQWAIKVDHYKRNEINKRGRLLLGEELELLRGGPWLSHHVRKPGIDTEHPILRVRKVAKAERFSSQGQSRVHLFIIHSLTQGIHCYSPQIRRFLIN